jgi:hypothetical protein
MIKAQSAPAVVPISYGLRAMGPADLPVVRGWLTQPHVTRWWPNPEVALRLITQHLGEPAIECFILTMDGEDAGYLQVYDPHHSPPPAADEHASVHPYRDRAALTFSLARQGASDEATDLASSGVSSSTSSRREYPAW